MTNSDNTSEESRDREPPESREQEEEQEQENEDVESEEIFLITKKDRIPVKFISEEVAKFAFRSGPLPTPEDLKGYAGISEDLVPRIISMAESEQSHTHKMDEMSLAAHISDTETIRTIEKRGQLLGFSIAFIALACGLIIALLGGFWPGGILGMFGVGSLISAFLARKDREPE